MPFIPAAQGKNKQPAALPPSAFNFAGNAGNSDEEDDAQPLPVAPSAQASTSKLPATGWTAFSGSGNSKQQVFVESSYSNREQNLETSIYPRTFLACQ